MRVKWINDLKEANGKFRPHLLTVDPTLHWANPPGGIAGRDYGTAGDSTDSLRRPTPTQARCRWCTHVHGAVGVGDESDGYAEAWYLPAGDGHPGRLRAQRHLVQVLPAQGVRAQYGALWGPGFATFQYPNENRASTIWYHDHTLGMTRLNVYAGPAGFYIVRGGPGRRRRGARTRGPG